MAYLQRPCMTPYGQNQLILSLVLISSSLWFSMMLPSINRDKENGARRMLFSQGIFTGMSSWPQSTTCIGTQSICTSMKSFHAIKEEIKSESLLATFFPPLTASQKGAGTMEALGCCELSIEMYC